jgi:methionyl-tRNA formyltransferase
MRIVFAGTPEFAALALDAILAAGHQVPLVLTQPDRPSGRGLKLTPSAVKQRALAAGIPVSQPLSLRLDGKHPAEAKAAEVALQKAAPDLMVVAAYGLILPQWVLSLPTHGCFNIHASLLPRWRGAAPIQRAIDAGDQETGITIMQMDQGLDTGDILLMSSLPITAEHTAARLHDELARLGASCILQAINDLGRGRLAPRPQPDTGVTYAAKLEKSEAPLDFGQSAQALARRVRAFNPVPGATMRLPGLDEPVKVWHAVALEQAARESEAASRDAGREPVAQPGHIVSVSAQGIDVATGQGVLRLLTLQKAGGKRQDVSVFVQGWHL